MLSTETEFPFVGSRGFVIGDGSPVTILQDCGDRGLLVRRDDLPRPGEAVHGVAAGNCRIPREDLVASHSEAINPQVHAKPKARRARKSAKAKASA